MTSIVLNTGCRHFRGSHPCMFNKLDGSECATCRHISEYRDRILFVKLDAIGDVLRTASVLPAIMARYDSPYIAWVTRRESVDLVDMLDHVDEVIEVSEIGLARVATGGWDQVFSLSNDVPSAAIATLGAGGRPIVGYGLASELGLPAILAGTFTSRLPMPVERFFALITQRAIRRGSFISTADLVKKIDRVIRTHNANSRPFVWTATAVSILQNSLDFVSEFLQVGRSSLCDPAASGAG
jgi:hypothetical protein